MNRSILTGITAVFCVLSFLFVACKDKTSDPQPNKCTGVVCENGGWCQAGTCACPRGFEGSKCQDKWNRRYVGKWEFEEKVLHSSKADNVGDSIKYVATIKEKDNNPVRFFIDDFMGNAAYDNVSCEIGLNNKRGQEPPVQFVFTQSQAVTGSYISINMGSGSVNDNGTYMTGEYYRTDIVNSTVVTDTVAFKASLVQ